MATVGNRNGDKRQSRIGDTPEKSNDRRGTQAAPASRGLAGQGIVVNEAVSVRHTERFATQESLRPGMGLAPSQEPQNQMKHVSAAIPPNLPAANVSPSISLVSNSSSKTAIEHDTTMRPSNVQNSEPEYKGLNLVQDSSQWPSLPPG